jgi:hypothetical protein
LAFCATTSEGWGLVCQRERERGEKRIVLKDREGERGKSGSEVFVELVRLGAQGFEVLGKDLRDIVSLRKGH